MNRVEADPELLQQIREAAAKSLVQMPTKPKRHDLPPYDDETDSPSSVYDLKSLLTPEGWAVLREKMDDVLSKTQALPSWVASIHHGLVNWEEVRTFATHSHLVRRLIRRDEAEGSKCSSTSRGSRVSCASIESR